MYFLVVLYGIRVNIYQYVNFVQLGILLWAGFEVVLPWAGFWFQAHETRLSELPMAFAGSEWG